MPCPYNSLRLDLLPLRIVERLFFDGQPDTLAEQLRLQPRSRFSQGQREVTVGDALAHGVAVAAGSDPADNLALVEDRLVPQADGRGVVQAQATQLLADAFLLLFLERFLPAEIAFVEADEETHSRFVRGVVRSDVGAPIAVAFFQAQRVDRLVPGRHQAVRLAGLPQRVPQRLAVFHSAVELPTLLPDVGNPHR